MTKEKYKERIMMAKTQIDMAAVLWEALFDRTGETTYDDYVQLREMTDEMIKQGGVPFGGDIRGAVDKGDR